MESIARQQREYQLVELMLGNRTVFRAECMRALGLSPAESLSGLDCDLIRAILDREFPPLVVQWCLPGGRHRFAAL
jgi:hypothetical protein